MKKVLITGGSGFIGRHLAKALIERYANIEVTSLSRSEGEISQLLNVFNHPDQKKRLKIVMADVRDREAIRVHLRNIDTVIHLAALKRVDLAESECAEVVMTNVFGTMNMLNDFKGDTFILMSTDKAVEPGNCYGATKMIAEKLVIEQACKREGFCRYIIVRSGNILRSTGSFMDIWHQQIIEFNEITITHPDMMRFVTTVESVIRLFIAILEKGENGKIYFTPHRKPIVIGEIAAKFIKQYGNENTKIRYIGLRPGERMKEKMFSPGEINTVSGFEETLELDTAPIDEIKSILVKQTF